MDSKLHSKRIAHVLSRLRDAQKKGQWKEKTLGEERFRVQIGHYKNGKVKMGTICGICGIKEVTGKKGFWNTDHIIPVRTVSGFVDFDTEIERMLPDRYGYAKMCIKCHDKKSEKEEDLRKQYRKAKNNEDKIKIKEEFDEYCNEIKKRLKKQYP